MVAEEEAEFIVVSEEGAELEVVAEEGAEVEVVAEEAVVEVAKVKIKLTTSGSCQ